MVGFSGSFGSWVGGGRRSVNRSGQCGEAVESRGQFVSPGPGRRDPQAEAASTAGEAGGNV